jgi:hypothetical protein
VENIAITIGSPLIADTMDARHRSGDQHEQPRTNGDDSRHHRARGRGDNSRQIPPRRDLDDAVASAKARARRIHWGHGRGAQPSDLVTGDFHGDAKLIFAAAAAARPQRRMSSRGAGRFVDCASFFHVSARRIEAETLANRRMRTRALASVSAAPGRASGNECLM